MNIHNIISSFLSTLVLAGDYALHIQSRIKSLPAKEGATLFSQALTDADLSIQTMFEIVLLAHFPTLNFDPEEAEQSRNLKYFVKDSEYTITLDPINGTRFYKDGLPLFDIIITIVRRGQIVGAVSYIPAQAKFYIAIEGEGAFTTTKDEVLEGRQWRRYTLPKNPEALVLTYRCPDIMEEQLATVINFKNMARDYNANDWHLTIHSVLSGKICAFLKVDADIIDWGAIAFIVEQAGGVVTDFKGQPIPNFFDFPNHRIPNIFCCVDDKTHSRLIAALSAS